MIINPNFTMNLHNLIIIIQNFDYDWHFNNLFIIRFIILPFISILRVN
jgi:hypothetical protein